MTQPSPTTTSSDAVPSEAAVRAAGASGAAGAADLGPADLGRGALLRALAQSLVLVAVVGAALGALLFGGDNLLAASDLPYYGAGLGAAAFAAILAVWIHGRFAATPAPSSSADPAHTAHLITSRLQSLLAAAFGVKLVVLVLAVVVLKQFPLGEETAKFSELTTFAVTFAGAALLAQLATAFALARTLRRGA